MAGNGDGDGDGKNDKDNKDDKDGKGKKGAETDEAALSGNALTEYRFAFAAALKKAERYPPRARADGITGSVTLLFTWSPAFSAPKVTLEKSSGSDLLDDEAVRIMTRAARLTPIPEALRARHFKFPQAIEFSLE